MRARRSIGRRGIGSIGCVAEIAAAVAFLTRLRMRTLDPGRSGASAFGLVGAALGGLGAVALVIVGETAPYAAGALAVGAIAAASGALHLDGLSDTADALVAPNAAASDRARTDPASGPGGVTAVAIVLLVDVGLLGALIAGPGLVVAAGSCVVAAAASRTAPVLAIVTAPPPAAPGGGLGGWFAARVSRPAAGLALVWCLAVAIAAALTSGTVALVIGAVGGLAISILVGRWLRAVRRGIDGDALGALVEITFGAALLVTVLAS